MHFTNAVLLSATLLASVSLLAIIQRRGLIRRLSLFFALLVFHVLRSAVLLAGLRFFDQEAYVYLAQIMSLFDLALQLTL